MENICLRKESLPPARVGEEEMMLSLQLGEGSEGSGSGEGGGARVRRNSLRVWMIWTKLGRKMGSSIQQDCIREASSAGISSLISGLAC